MNCLTGVLCEAVCVCVCVRVYIYDKKRGVLAGVIFASIDTLPVVKL